jgi:hypothetical protein
MICECHEINTCHRGGYPANRYWAAEVHHVPVLQKHQSRLLGAAIGPSGEPTRGPGEASERMHRLNPSSSAPDIH